MTEEAEEEQAQDIAKIDKLTHAHNIRQDIKSRASNQLIITLILSQHNHVHTSRQVLSL